MLTIHPKEIYLEGPYNAEQWTRFALINNLPKNQAFKIKSTKPDRIGISPHCGFIRALDRVEVSEYKNFLFSICSDAGDICGCCAKQREFGDLVTLKNEFIGAKLHHNCKHKHHCRAMMITAQKLSMFRVSITGSSCGGFCT